MCTSISYRKKNHYFGRNLDVDFSFQEQVAITPRNYLFPLKNGTGFRNRYALIGMAAVLDDYPLYYEASNEKGLAMAGLNFPGNAFYGKTAEGKDNLSPFELIPWILGQAASVREVRMLIRNLNITNLPFRPDFPLSPLHFMISDPEESIVMEPMEDGIHLYDNPYDVMTNNPPFDYHLTNLHQYLNLSPKNEKNRFSPSYELTDCGVGMGAIGLPGDCSSPSRFVRAAFHLTNSCCPDTEEANVSQFFHVLDSVSMTRGAVLTRNGKNDITLYSCCINTEEGIYYYKTYDNSRITAVSLNSANESSKTLTVFPLRKEADFRFEN